MWALAFVVTICLLQTIRCENDGDSKIRVTVASLGDCELPEDSYDRENYIPHHMLLYKADRQTLVRGNFTADHNIGPISTFIRCYEVTGNSRLNRVFDFANLNCSDVFVKSFINMLKVNYTGDCFLLPGSYNIDDFNAQKLERFISLVWRDGRYAYDIEFRTPHGVVTCIRAVLDITPISPPKSPKKMK